MSPPGFKIMAHTRLSVNDNVIQHHCLFYTATYSILIVAILSFSFILEFIAYYGIPHIFIHMDTSNTHLLDY